jgi:hypothetical protein
MLKFKNPAGPIIDHGCYRTVVWSLNLTRMAVTVNRLAKPLSG